MILRYIDIKNLKAEIEEDEARIQEINGEISDLEDEIQDLEWEQAELKDTIQGKCDKLEEIKRVYNGEEPKTVLARTKRRPASEATLTCFVELV
jgi:predicted  nucleic acid-binding Zn-ribbon protein